MAGLSPSVQMRYEEIERRNRPVPIQFKDMAESALAGAQTVEQIQADKEKKRKASEFQKILDAKLPAMQDAWSRLDDSRKQRVPQPDEMWTQDLNLQTSWWKLFSEQEAEGNFTAAAAGKPYDEQVQAAQGAGAITTRDALTLARPSRNSILGQTLTEEQARSLDQVREMVNRRRSRLGRDVSKQEMLDIMEDIGLPSSLLSQKAVKEYLGAGVGSMSGEREKQMTATEKGKEVQFYEEGAEGTPDGKPIPKAARKDVDALQADYDKQVKDLDFKTLKAKALTVRNLIARGTPVSDMGVIFNFMKLLDPPSVVRESEYQTAVSIGGLYEKFLSKWGKVTGEELLAPGQRQDFWASVKEILSAYNEFAQEVNQDFSRRAQQRGIKPEWVTKPISLDIGDIEFADPGPQKDTKGKVVKPDAPTQKAPRKIGRFQVEVEK
jgi:hypothetical protein